MTAASANAWISTFSGRRFYVLDPRPQDVDIVDIAHALSLQCRFSGHIRQFYSVAEHCVRVSDACPEHGLWALLHDASEAFIGDMSAPLKHTSEMSRYRTTEKRIMHVIAERFGLTMPEPPEVKIADRRMLLTEARDLGICVDGWYTEQVPFEKVIRPWPPTMAEATFLQRFHALAPSAEVRIG